MSTSDDRLSPATSENGVQTDIGDVAVRLGPEPAAGDTDPVEDADILVLASHRAPSDGQGPRIAARGL